MVALAHYLSILPTVKKKLTVMVDWTIDFLFKPDVSMIKRTDLTIDTDEERTNIKGSTGTSNRVANVR